MLNCYIDTRLLYMEPACIVGLQVAMLELADSGQFFFFCLVCRLTWKKKI